MTPDQAERVRRNRELALQRRAVREARELWEATSAAEAAESAAPGTGQPDAPAVQVVAARAPVLAAPQAADPCEWWATSVSNSKGETCAACLKLRGRGCKIRRCRNCRRVVCIGCTGRDADACRARGGARPAGAPPPPGPATLEHWWGLGNRVGEQPDLTENTEALLSRLAGRPCPPTLRHIPAKLRDRVADVLAALLEVAVAATESQADVHTQLRAHQLLWLAPAMILAAPRRRVGNLNDPLDDAAGPAAEASATAELRRRLRLAEQGDWHGLLIELDERVRSSTLGNKATAARGPPSPDEQEAWASRIVDKVRGGCLRTAAQLAVGDAHAPACAATADAVAALVAIPPEEGSVGRTREVASQILAQQWLPKVPGRRVVRRRARLLRTGAEPGPSGWRNAAVQALALSARHCPLMTRWVVMWAHGAVPEAVAQLWTGAALVALLKPSGGVRPIALGEAMLKFAEVCILEMASARIRRLLEPQQVGCRTPGGAEAAIEALRAAAGGRGVAVLQLDLKNAYGQISRDEMLEALRSDAPELARCAAAQWRGAVCAWTRDGEGWRHFVTERGGWQGSALMQTAFAIALTWRLRATLPQGRGAGQAPPETTAFPDNERNVEVASAAAHGWVAYADDTHVVGTPLQLEHSMQLLRESLPHGGHALQLAKCHVWCPHPHELDEENAAAFGRLRAVVAEAPAGLVVLGGGSGGEDYALTEAMAEPMRKRVDRALAIAHAAVRLARAETDVPVLQASWLLVTKVAARLLDFDARIAEPCAFEAAALEVTTAVREAVQVILDGHITDSQWRQLQLPGYLGGCGVRRPGLCQQAAAVLSDSTSAQLAASIQAEWGIDDAGRARAAQIERAGAALAERGIVLGCAHVTLTSAARARVEASPWEVPTGRRAAPTLSGALAHSEVLDACDLWHDAPGPLRLELQSGSGQGAGQVWQALPTRRELQFGDCHWRQMLRTKLGADGVLPGSGCQLPRKDGHCCGVTLDTALRHVDACRHGSAALRVHRAVQHALARCLRRSGANVDIERFMAHFTTPDSPEAILDIVAHWPASSHLFAIDVTVRNPSAARYQHANDVAAVAEGEKERRYGLGALPLALWSGGGLGPRSETTLQALAAEARAQRLQDADASGLVSEWRLEVEAALLRARADNCLRAAGRNWSAAAPATAGLGEGGGGGADAGDAAGARAGGG